MLPSPSSSSSSTSPPSASKPLAPRPSPRNPSKPNCRWKTLTQQRLYNRRLLDALRRPSPRPSTARSIKDAADSALAVAARGQSRWSRAILTGRCRRRVLLKAAGGKVRRRKPKKPLPLPPPSRAKSPEGRVEERLKKLGRLVPGCRKLPATRLLEEAADYVAALEVQVRAMRALAEAMASAALTGSPAEEVEAGDGRD